MSGRATDKSSTEAQLFPEVIGETARPEQTKSAQAHEAPAPNEGRRRSQHGAQTARWSWSCFLQGSATTTAQTWRRQQLPAPT